MPVLSRRSDTSQVDVGGVKIGGGAPVSVQSMTNVPTTETRLVVEQIRKLTERGAEIVRVAVPDRESALSLKDIVAGSDLPVVADVHFDPELALIALAAGIHKLRLNPGNIRDRRAVWKIAERAALLEVPIRIGVNSGSLPGDLRERYGGVNADSMWATAERHIKLLSETGFKDMVLSLKSSSVLLTIEANRKASSSCDYPIHLGVTEAGFGLPGSVRSSVAVSILLAEGIGDTLRISLSGPPERELPVAWEILTSLGIRERRFPKIVSCPTCARARMDVGEVAEKVQKALEEVSSNVTIAVMGCEVNGPGEAREADIAVIGTPSGLQLFVEGRMQETVRISNLADKLVDTVISYITGKSKSQEE
jgi:(E)-4-hydroxy-3-methylbut-2-enyl-diphosphate synthase